MSTTTSTTREAEVKQFAELYEELHIDTTIAKNDHPNIDKINQYIELYNTLNDLDYKKPNNIKVSTLANMLWKLTGLKVENPTSSPDIIKRMETSHQQAIKLMEDSFQKQIQDLEYQRNTLNTMMQEVSDISKREMELKSREIQKLKLETDQTKKEVDVKTKELQALQLETNENKKEIQDLKDQNTLWENAGDMAKAGIKARDKEIQGLNLANEARKKEIVILQERITNLDNEIDQLKKIKSSLEAAASTVDLSAITKPLQDELARKEQALKLEEKKFNTRTDELKQLAEAYKLLLTTSSKERKEKEDAFDKIEAKALIQLNQIESLNKTIANLQATIADLNKATVDAHALELTKQNAAIIQENERLRQENAELKKLRRKSYPSAAAVIPILSKIKGSASVKKDPTEVRQFLAVIASAYM